MKFKFKKTAGTDYRGSSEALKKIEDLGKVINHRMIVFSIVLAILMSTLIARLYQIQVINANHYEAALITNTTNYISADSQRGDIVDRNGVQLVSSTPRNVITYAKTESLSTAQIWQISTAFVQHFTISLDKQTTDDLRLLYVQLHLDDMKTKVNPDDLMAYTKQELTDAQFTQKMMDVVTDDDLKTLTDIEKKAYVVKTILENASTSSFNVVKDNATDAEVAYLAEHIGDFPGFLYLKDWDRQYSTTSLHDLLGQITSSEQGLLAESAEYYQALGYSMNSRVGRSGLEMEYEQLLAGNKAKYQIVTSSTGNIVYQKVSDGSKGATLQSSIDLNLQTQIEAIAANFMNSQANVSARSKNDHVYLIVQKPSTGEMLAIVDMVKASDGTYYNDAAYAFTDASAIEIGSTIKGAIVYMGMDTGTNTESTIVNDTPWEIPGTNLKKSWAASGLGLLNYKDALALSSNVYMWDTVVRLAGGTYVKNQELVLPKAAQTFSVIRSYLSQFGLGVSTQVDFPKDDIGLINIDSENSYLLDMVIGQYDTYTPIQLSQYVSTIANNGNRVKLRLVTQAVDSQTNKVIWQNPNEILSQLTNAQALKDVQDGFRYCVTKSNGLCKQFQTGLPSNIEVYAKTGTSQVIDQATQEEYWNHLAISYSKQAGSDTADISVVCAVPKSTSAAGNLSTPCPSLVNSIYRLYYSQ